MAQGHRVNFILNFMEAGKLSRLTVLHEALLGLTSACLTPGMLAFVCSSNILCVASELCPCCCICSAFSALFFAQLSPSPLPALRDLLSSEPNEGPAS